MDTDDFKSNQKAGTSASSSDHLIDKDKLFANLLKIQYPMAQDESLYQQESNEDAGKTYQDRMDEVIKKYENEL